MKKIIILIITICITVGFLGKNVFGNIDDSDILAKSAVLIDGNSGRILYGKNEKTKMPMASTTKIMTCIVALENGKLNDKILVSENAESMPKVKMNIKKGEEYYLKDLLYAMMLESYNDVAMTVAEGIAGSQENFARMMNNKAKEIGAKDTNFVTPNGLDANEHYSTAYDMALIGAYAVKNKDFLAITNTKNYSFDDVNGKRKFTVNNKDSFLSMDKDAIGIKTGFTGKAGYCFVGAVKSNGRIFISCVLGCGWPPNKSYKWKDTVKLMNYGKNNFEYKKIIKQGYILTINIQQGTKDSIKGVFSQGCCFMLSKDEKINIKSNINYKLPIKKGDDIGNVEVYINNKIAEKLYIKSLEKVEKYDYKYVFKSFVRGFFMFYL